MHVVGAQVRTFVPDFSNLTSLWILTLPVAIVPSHQPPATTPQKAPRPALEVQPWGSSPGAAGCSQAPPPLRDFKLHCRHEHVTNPPSPPFPPKERPGPLPESSAQRPDSMARVAPHHRKRRTAADTDTLRPTVRRHSPGYLYPAWCGCVWERWWVARDDAHGPNRPGRSPFGLLMSGAREKPNVSYQ